MRISKTLKKNREKVAIIGLGYVGLPLILKFIKSQKYDLVGIDQDQKKIQSLKKGKSYISHIANSEIRLIRQNAKEITWKLDVIKTCNYIIYALPTPITKNKDPDMSYIESALNSSKNFFKRKQLVILESTVYPGATEEYFLNTFKERGLVVGKDIFLGYSPEREDPGNKNFNISNITKLVSGYSKPCLIKCEKLYKSINIKTQKVSSIKTAEITKLYENIFRSVNIGLVNEMKLISDKMEIDIHEIIKAAKSKPFGFQPFYPGPGLGGHCIPIDPYLLTWKAKQYDMNTKFIELSGDINNSMPNYVIDKIGNALNSFKKSFLNSKILILGVAYKKNVDDTRESPSLKIIELLKSKGVLINFHDKYVKNLKISLNNKVIKINSVRLSKSKILSYDLVCIVTDHDNIDYNLVEKYSKIVVDCRGRLKKSKKIYKA
jgi:UDP-N-acetyl-D-glucosamine dehydrogenase